MTLYYLLIIKGPRFMSGTQLHQCITEVNRSSYPDTGYEKLFTAGEVYPRDFMSD